MRRSCGVGIAISPSLSALWCKNHGLGLVAGTADACGGGGAAGGAGAAGAVEEEEGSDGSSRAASSLSAGRGLGRTKDLSVEGL